MTFQSLPFLKCGVQCNNLVICRNHIYDISGYCTGDKRNPRNPRMIRGFKTMINEFDLNNPEKGWIVRDKLELQPRMGAMGFSYQDEIYIWGGFYFSPLSNQKLRKYKGGILPPKDNILNYCDGIKISFVNDKIIQTKLPDLPYSHCLGQATVVGNQAFFLGGSYYCHQKGYDAEFDIDGTPIGKVFYSINLDNLSEGFKIINNYPGSPIFCHNLVEYQNKLYVLGGACTTKTDYIKKNGSEYRSLNVVDNWIYNTITNQWSRFETKLPLIMVNYSAVRVKNKIFMFGGVRYTKTFFLDRQVIMNTDQVYQEFGLEEQGFLPYGKISDMVYPHNHRRARDTSTSGNYSNMIMMYDFEQDKFTILDQRMPVNIVIPTLVNQPDDNYSIYFGGGEANLIRMRGGFWYTHPYQFMKIDMSQYFPSD